MYEATPLTVKALREALANMPDDAVVAGGCCQGSSTAHVVNDVKFDDYRDPSTIINMPAIELAKAADGTLIALLNTDDDYVGLDGAAGDIDPDGFED